MKKRPFPWPLCLALLGAAQIPFHIPFHLLLRTAQGERIEEILGGVLTRTAAWALFAVAALLLIRFCPLEKGRDLTVVLSCTGLILFAGLVVLFVIQFL